MSETVRRLEKALALVKAFHDDVDLLHSDIHWAASEVGGRKAGKTATYPSGGHVATFRVKGHPGKMAHRASDLLRTKGHHAEVMEGDHGYYNGAVTVTHPKDGRHLFRLQFAGKGSH